MSVLKWLLKAVVLLAGLWAFWYISIFWYKPFAIEDFYERIALRYLLPREAWLTGAVSARQNIRVGIIFQPRPPALLREWEINPADVAADLEVLKSYRRDKQSLEQLLSTDALTWQMQQLINADTCLAVEHPFNPFSGIHLIFVERLLLTQTPQNAKEIREYLEQLAGFATTTSQALKKAIRLDSRCKQPLPCFAVLTSKNQLMRFLSVRPASNPIYLHFRRHLARLETSLEAKQELDAEALLLLQTTIYPAFQAIYDYLHQYDCTSFLPPQQALIDSVQYHSYFHRFANRMVEPHSLYQYAARLTDSLVMEIEKLLKVPSGKSWQSAYRKLNQTYHLRYPQRAKELAEALSQAGMYLDSVVSYLFENTPAIKHGLYRMPVALEGFISTGNPHPSQAQLLYNPSDSAFIPPAEVMAFAALEIMPGRLMQRAYQRQQNKLPTFRRYWDEPVFTNGWSSYIASLIAEEKIFDNIDDYCGLLHQQLARAALTVVDIGMHLYSWKYGDAVLFLVRNTALPVVEINRRLHRLLLFPAYYCTYIMGGKLLLVMRKQAQEVLGTIFDIRQFHHYILSQGSLPAHLMERPLKLYIAAAKKFHLYG
ncbi:MAG: DUF885 family protein [Cytophagales bacterium]|nr:DUF885 domain-containing protein [Bernardetiaceae bacterium]MDW8211241.1 DUF885 family protein [Cytophagales bacterium]